MSFVEISNPGLLDDELGAIKMMILDGYFLPGVQRSVINSAFSENMKTFKGLTETCGKINPVVFKRKDGDRDDESKDGENLYRVCSLYSTPQSFTDNLLMQSAHTREKKNEGEFDFMFKVPEAQVFHSDHDACPEFEVGNIVNPNYFRFSMEYEWIRTFLMHLGYFLVDLGNVCNVTKCPKMNGPDHYTFLCSTHKGPSMECCAIDYCLHTIDLITTLFLNVHYYPNRRCIGRENHNAFGIMCRRLVRIFIHAFFHHRDVFNMYEGDDDANNGACAVPRGVGAVRGVSVGAGAGAGGGGRKGYRLYSKFRSFCTVHGFIDNKPGEQDFKLIKLPGDLRV